MDFPAYWTEGLEPGLSAGADHLWLNRRSVKIEQKIVASATLNMGQKA
jgi:hypothetical protein